MATGDLSSDVCSSDLTRKQEACLCGEIALLLLHHSRPLENTGALDMMTPMNRVQRIKRTQNNSKAMH